MMKIILRLMLSSFIISISLSGIALCEDVIKMFSYDAKSDQSHFSSAGQNRNLTLIFKPFKIINDGKLYTIDLDIAHHYRKILSQHLGIEGGKALITKVKTIRGRKNCFGVVVENVPPSGAKLCLEETKFFRQAETGIDDSDTLELALFLYADKTPVHFIPMLPEGIPDFTEFYELMKEILPDFYFGPRFIRQCASFSYNDEENDFYFNTLRIFQQNYPIAIKLKSDFVQIQNGSILFSGENKLSIPMQLNCIDSLAIDYTNKYGKRVDKVYSELRLDEKTVLRTSKDNHIYYLKQPNMINRYKIRAISRHPLYDNLTYKFPYLKKSKTAIFERLWVFSDLPSFLAAPNEGFAGISFISTSPGVYEPVDLGLFHTTLLCTTFILPRLEVNHVVLMDVTNNPVDRELIYNAVKKFNSEPNGNAFYLLSNGDEYIKAENEEELEKILGLLYRMLDKFGQPYDIVKELQNKYLKSRIYDRNARTVYHLILSESSTKLINWDIDWFMRILKETGINPEHIFIYTASNSVDNFEKQNLNIIIISDNLILINE